jgi:hypothetical protein
MRKATWRWESHQSSASLTLQAEETAIMSPSAAPCCTVAAPCCAHHKPVGPRAQSTSTSRPRCHRSSGGRPHDLIEQSSAQAVADVGAAFPCLRSRWSRRHRTRPTSWRRGRRGRLAARWARRRQRRPSSRLRYHSAGSAGEPHALPCMYPGHRRIAGPAANQHSWSDTLTGTAA